MSETLQDTIRRTLPDLLRADPNFRYEILEITRAVYADRDETAARFDRVLAELQRDREAQSRNWAEAAREREREREEQNRKWEEQNRNWAEAAREREREREEQNRKWAEAAREREREREEQNRKWDEQNRKWDEQNRKWDQQMAENRALFEEIRKSRLRQEQALGAIGARWGIASEQSFRDALKAILEQSFGVQVLNYNDYDASGMVFGAPDQVEIDVIIKNGEVILCELKSSLSKADLYLFDRKAAFYAQRHQCTVTRKLAISPMVRPDAHAAAARLGIEVYGYAEDARLEP